MTNSNSDISTNAYDPKKLTNVWNFRTPSTRMTKKTNQQRQNIAAYLIFRFFSFILNYPKSGYKFSDNSAIIVIFVVYFK